MDTIPDSQGLLETSFEFSHYNQDNIIISFGPKNGFLWRGESFDSEKGLIESLNNIFQTSFTQRNEQSVLANLACVQRYPDFICASNTHCNGSEFTGLENEELSAGTYGYIYLIDTNKKNDIQSIPLCEENLLNSNFVVSYVGEPITEGPDYAIISKIDPKYIIGAMPSAFVAFALGIEEKSFIMNPAYQGVFYFDKIKEFSEISLFSTLSALSLKYPNLPVEEVYQNYLRADEMAAQSRSLSADTNAASATFFYSQSQLSKSKPASESTSYQCGR